MTWQRLRVLPGGAVTTGEWEGPLRPINQVTVAVGSVMINRKRRTAGRETGFPPFFAIETLSDNVEWDLERGPESTQQTGAVLFDVFRVAVRARGSCVVAPNFVVTSSDNRPTHRSVRLAGQRTVRSVEGGGWGLASKPLLWWHTRKPSGGGPSGTVPTLAKKPFTFRGGAGWWKPSGHGVVQTHVIRSGMETVTLLPGGGGNNSLIGSSDSDIAGKYSRSPVTACRPKTRTAGGAPTMVLLLKE